jgi:hypothetical protein
MRHKLRVSQSRDDSYIRYNTEKAKKVAGWIKLHNEKNVQKGGLLFTWKVYGRGQVTWANVMEGLILKRTLQSYRGWTGENHLTTFVNKSTSFRFFKSNGIPWSDDQLFKKDSASHSALTASERKLVTAHTADEHPLTFRTNRGSWDFESLRICQLSPWFSWFCSVPPNRY